MIVYELMREESADLGLTDSSRAALALYKTYGRSILKMLKETEHGRYLIEIGFLEDIKLSAQVDSYPVLPVLNGNVIKLLKDEE